MENEAFAAGPHIELEECRSVGEPSCRVLPEFGSTRLAVRSQGLQKLQSNSGARGVEQAGP